MSTHTPGPWLAEPNSAHGILFSVIWRTNEGRMDGYQRDQLVARFVSPDDARLIAAAPDMLAALKLADTILDGFPLYATGHGGKTIRAAIAKAEGTT